MKEITEELYSDLNRHDLDCFVTHLTADFVEHEDLPGGASGVEGVRQWFQATFDAFPDVRLDPEDVILGSDRSVIRIRMHGTHTGTDFMGLPAQGKSFDFELVDIMRFDGDRVAEHWGVADTLKLMQQLGAIPS